MLEAGAQPLFDPKEYPETAKLPRAQQERFKALDELFLRKHKILQRRALLKRMGEETPGNSLKSAKPSLPKV